MVEIKKINIKQTAKVIALLYGLFTIIIFAPVTFIMFLIDRDLTVFIYLFVPLVYVVFGYFGVAVFSWAYNIIAKRFGGIKFELESTNSN